MPNEPEKNTIPTNKPTTIHAHQLPIDLANKVIVKPANDNSKMSTFRTIQQPQMRVVRMPGTGSTGAQIIQSQLMPQTILKPTIPVRSTITVSKSPAANYFPRVATLNTIQGTKGTQQIRTPTPPSSVAGISPAIVRTSFTPRTSSPNAVLSQGTAAWVSGSGAMQVQVPQQIIRSTIAPNRTITANIFNQQTGQQGSTISVSATTSGTSGQPTYVATVLPQRPQGATIVYTSQQQQPYIQGQVQRMGITTGTANTRPIRPIRGIQPSGIRVNTSTLSIRQNVPGLAPTTVLATQPRNTLASSTTISNTIPARIFQVSSNQAPGGSQVIGQANQKILQANVMLPIIVNNRLTHSVKSPLQPGIIAHVSKITQGAVSGDGAIISNSITNTMPSMPNTVQVSQGSQLYTTQSQGQGNQIITVSQQQQQLINQQTVVPLAIGARNANIPIKTITVSASNSENPVTVHRNLTSQATTIMPIAKIVTQQQVVNQQATPVYIQTRIPAVSTGHQVISAAVSSSTPTFSSSNQTATVYYEPASSDSKATTTEPYAVSSPANVRYSDNKMTIHSIIASSFQNQNSTTQQPTSQAIRFSPMVEGQGSSQPSHQIISMGTSQNIVQSNSEASHMVIPMASQVPTSPRASGSILKKQNETTPVKAAKKPPKVKTYQIAETLQQMRVPQRPPMAAGVAQLTQNLKPIEPRQHSTASSPKTIFSERESPSQADEWSDGSTTVSIPNSPRSEDDLDAMIMSSQFGKMSEDFSGFKVKTPVKGGSGVKRDAGDNQLTPRKKMKR
jgi:hypothetical protein